VQRSEPQYEQDRWPSGKKGEGQENKVELIVERFFGCKRATGIGPSEGAAAEALASELARAFPDGPVLPEHTGQRKAE
jgi:hypothetical protein